MIVFIPFILMTYITSLLFFVFGLNPSKDDQTYDVVYPEEQVVRRKTPNVANQSSTYVSNNNNNNTGTTADDYNPNDFHSGTPSDINNYN